MPESKDSIIVEAEKPAVNNVNKEILNNSGKEGIVNAEETNENQVLEEPGNEQNGINNEHLNQIGIPPRLEKHNNGHCFTCVLSFV